MILSTNTQRFHLTRLKSHSGVGRLASSKHIRADLDGVEVVVDEGVNERRDLALDDEVARGLQVGDDCTQPSTQLKWVKP